jgi:spermidine synthase
MPISIPWYKKIASYIYAILIQKVNSQYSPDAELVLFHNQLMLTTPQAMYSYGIKYAPFHLAFNYLQKQKQLQPTKLLLLGGALLSAAQILHYKYKMHPAITVVEIDGKYKQMVFNYLPTAITENITYHHQDAETFVGGCVQQFDMIGIDIFIQLQVPEFCIEAPFLNHCKSLLTDNGIVIMNTHFINIADKNSFTNTFSKIFTQVQIIPHGNNYIYVAQK